SDVVDVAHADDVNERLPVDEIPDRAAVQRRQRGHATLEAGHATRGPPAAVEHEAVPPRLRRPLRRTADRAAGRSSAERQGVAEPEIEPEAHVAAGHDAIEDRRGGRWTWRAAVDGVTLVVRVLRRGERAGQCASTLRELERDRRLQRTGTQI